MGGGAWTALDQSENILFNTSKVTTAYCSYPYSLTLTLHANFNLKAKFHYTMLASWFASRIA